MKRIFRKFGLAFWLASIILAGVILIALVPGLFTKYDPVAQDFTALLQAPSSVHPFGTDNLGRDVLSRVVYSARLDLMIGLVAMIVPAMLGTLIGILSGYYGGKVDALIMRILDIFTAFPTMVLVIAIVAIMGSGVRNLFVAIWLVGWREYAKLVRSDVLVVRNNEYISAARSLGFSDLRIMLRHILPNVISTVVVYGITDIMMCMLMGASLSFLGLGVPTPTPEWGAIISDGKNYMMTAWWIITFPGIMLAVTGISISLVGSGLSRVLTDKR